MKYTPKTDSRKKGEAQDSDSLYFVLEPVAKGLGMAVLDLSVCRRKGRGGNPGNVQVRVALYKAGKMGLDDCSRFHKAILPRMELAFPGSDVYLEVSSPGIGRLIKDGSEMALFTGRVIKCYCAQTPGAEIAANDSGWIKGALKGSDENGITLETENGEIVLKYEAIAKAKLDETDV